MGGHLAVVQFLCCEGSVNALAEDSHGFSAFALASWSHHKASNSVELRGGKDREELALVKALKSVKDFLELQGRRRAAGTV
eukprot:12278734-Karenia_brevis.AAC.1